MTDKILEMATNASSDEDVSYEEVEVTDDSDEGEVEDEVKEQEKKQENKTIQNGNSNEEELDEGIHIIRKNIIPYKIVKYSI